MNVCVVVYFDVCVCLRVMGDVMMCEKVFEVFEFGLLIVDVCV